MQPFNFNAGNEALRCLSIAENLLTSRDYAKCKLYATRARESDPRMEQSEQMIAIADTLMAGENRVSNQQIDWYGVLRVESNCSDMEVIGSQYRRLCVLLNPTRNRFPFVENAYQLVNQAWLVLSNPARKMEFDSVIRNESFVGGFNGAGNFAGYNFIPQPGETGPGPGPRTQQHQQQQQHNGSKHYSFIQEHSEQLQKQHQQHYEQQQQQFLQPFGEQQLFPSQQHWSNQGQQQAQVQQQEIQGQHWSQSQQQLHWSQVQPEQGVHWSQQQQQQNLPWQSQAQQVLPQRSATPQPQVPAQQMEQNWPQHQQQQQPLPWQQARQPQPLVVPQQAKPFRQPTPPPQTKPEPPQPQPPIQQPLPWHHSQTQLQSTRPLPQKPLRQPTPPPQQPSRQPTPPPQLHQPQTQLQLPKSPPPRQQQQPVPQSQLYQPVAQQPLPWHQSLPQQPLARAEPQPQKPLHQPTIPLQNPLRQFTPPPEIPLHQSMPSPQNPLRQPTPPPKLQPLVTQLSVPKLEQQPQEQQPRPWHQSKQQPPPSAPPQLQQPLSQSPPPPQLQQPLSLSPPPPQQQQPLPQPEPSLLKAQPLAQQPTLNTVVQSLSPRPQSLLPESEILQHFPQYQTQTPSEPQVPSQPLPQQQSQQSQRQPQSLQDPQPQPKLKPQSQPKPQPQPKFQPQPPPQPQTHTLKPPAESQDRGENGKFQEVGQQGRNIAGEKSGDNDGNPHIVESSFWTGCPYCYNMYEYPGRYAEFTLRCQNCKRAFHAAKVSTPPGAAEGKEAYFCSWALFPLGVSASYMEQCKAAASTWAPISNMFVVPQGENHCHGGKRKNKRPSTGPYIYIDDDQDYVHDVPLKEDSDDEDWHITKKKKSSRSPKGKSSTSKKVKPPKVEKSKKVKGSKIGNSQPVLAAQVGEGFGVPNMEVPSMPVGDPSKKAASVITRNRPGVVLKDMGKLDLNVEFSNEVEEPAKGTSGGTMEEQGEEDNAEGTAFFDGLDEFLGSLPILSVDGGDKEKAG